MKERLQAVAKTLKFMADFPAVVTPEGLLSCASEIETASEFIETETADLRKQVEDLAKALDDNWVTHQQIIASRK